MDSLPKSFTHPAMAPRELAHYQLRSPLFSLLTRSFLEALISRRRRGTIPLAVYSPAPKVDYDSSRRQLAPQLLEKNQEARTRLRSLPFFRPFFRSSESEGFHLRFRGVSHDRIALEGAIGLPSEFQLIIGPRDRSLQSSG